MNSSKLKLFVENFLIYGLGSVISKIIPLVMLPIVTRLMPDTSYFGINDLFNTVASFAGAIATMGMFDGMYRMFFEKNEIEYQKSVCSTTLIFTTSLTVVVCIMMIVLRKIIACYIFGGEEFSYLVCLASLATMVSATNNIISAPTRMKNKRGIYLLTNTFSSIFSYIVTIPLLLKGHYYIALPIASIISGLIIECVYFIINIHWFRISLFNPVILKQTLKIAIPLCPNFLVYWIFNSCDRLMISQHMTVYDVGIYSIGAKLGNMSQLIYNAFAGGWLYFSFSTMKEENQVKSNSNIFEYMTAVSLVATSLVFGLSKFIYGLLFSGDYVLGYQIAPILFLAPLLQMLFQIVCNQFVIIKKSWPNVVLLSVGAVFNILLNELLIPVIGIEGAALATVFGYGITLIMTIIILNKMKLFIMGERLIKIVIPFLIYAVCWRIVFRTNTSVGVILAFVYILIVIYMYKHEIRFVIEGVKNKLNGKK